MSADLLRRAAARLDELAVAATRGPWRVAPIAKRADVRGLPENTSGDYRGDSIATAADSEFGACSQSSAAYIAAMHPGVGKALAAWLRGEANALHLCPGHVAVAALTVAREILGADA